MPVTSHAKVSPSGLTRSTKCSASIKASEGYQSTGSYAAWEGSVNHEMNVMRLLGNLAGVFATLGAVALLALVLSLWRISSGLPNYEHLANYTPPVMSRVHAGDGSLIAEYAQERRLFVPIDVVPEHVINAFLAAEDKNFYNHKLWFAK